METLSSASAGRGGAIERFMTDDHARLDGLLTRARNDDGTVDELTYDTFREGLLRHIAMEEKVLLPLCRGRSQAPLEIAPRLRADHGRIAKLLTRRPDRALLDVIRAELAAHNAIEECPSGLYAQADALAAGDAPDILAALRAIPPVPLARYYDGPSHARRSR